MKLYHIHKCHNDSYLNHQLIKELFPNEGKILIHNLNNKLLILSDIEIAKEYKNCFHISYIKDVDNNSFSINEQLPFSIRLNSSKMKYGKRFSVPLNELEQWCDNKLSNIGATIIVRQINNEGLIQSKRKNQICSHSSVFIQGMLQITNNKQFFNTIYQGIGHAKAFGFGLLNVF
jgi:CRISPR-associated protein Cas6/Cse3/CasE subtype I-E